MNEEEPEAPVLGEQGALPSHLFNHRTLPTLPCCPWLPVHCPVLWGDGHLSTFPITQVHRVTQASLPWAWPPASLFHSLPHQPSWGPVPSHSVSRKYFLLVQPVKSQFFRLAFKGAPPAPGPSSQPNLLLSQALRPSQTELFPQHPLHTPPQALCSAGSSSQPPAAHFLKTHQKCSFFKDSPKTPPLPGSFPWPATTRCHFSDPAAPIQLCQCLTCSLYHGHLRLFLPVTLRGQLL